MSNLCKECKLICCQRFTLSSEKYDPKNFEAVLKPYPFIIRTGETTVKYNGQNVVIGIYTCTRFNPKTGECDNYSIVPRPFFCIRTGDFDRPHPNCLL